MVSGPEVCRVIEEFQSIVNFPEKLTSDSHHEEMPGKQKKFHNNVNNFLTVMRDNGNPFCDDSGDLTTLDTKVIMSEKSKENLQSLHSLGKGQFSKYVDERLIKRQFNLMKSSVRIASQFLVKRGRKVQRKTRI